MKNILICPLDWGMGHATRVRSIAYRLHDQGHNVIVAASESLLGVFDESVCTEKVIFNSLRVRYSKRLPAYLVVFLQAPLLVLQFLSDRYRTGRLVKKHGIDIVISDNRFGCRSGKAFSVYITHQLSIKLPGRTALLARILSAIHRRIAAGYDECWIPDVEDGLAAELTAHGDRLKARYTGILSMLDTCEELRPEGFPWGTYYAVIISGPEPQRGLLEEKLMARLSGTAERFVFAAGNIAGSGFGLRGSRDNIWYYSCLGAGEMKYVLGHSKGVICRGGYSTLMDLVVLGKGAIVVPTPGQTEQEYLAGELDARGWVKQYKQHEIDDLDTGKLPDPKSFGTIKEESGVLLDKALWELISLSSSR